MSRGSAKATGPQPGQTKEASIGWPLSIINWKLQALDQIPAPPSEDQANHPGENEGHGGRLRNRDRR
jgi:hypothetical protein